MAKTGYVNPLPGGATKMRADRGRDFQGKPGDPVVAIGRARIDFVKDDPHGYGKAVYYTLLDGPYKGTQIFVGHAMPAVKPGQVIAAGKPVAILQQSGLGDAAGRPGWTEIGVAKGGVPMYDKNHGGKAIDAILSGLQNAPAPDTTGQESGTTAPAPDASALQQAQDQQTADDIAQIPQEPSAFPPTFNESLAGDGMDTSVAPQGAGSTTSSWQMIVNNGPTSDYTQYLAQLSQSASNGGSA